MNIRNTTNGFGLVSIILHWLMALLIIGLFISGYYMVDLDYYSKWYNLLPWWHIAVGVTTFLLLLLRIIWRWTNPRPAALSSYHGWEKTAAGITHYAFYVLLLLISVTGYFITTAKGAPIDFFGWFDIPALTALAAGPAEWAGKIHEYAAYAVAGLFALHVGATVKHHFIDKDITFIRILKPTDIKENKP